MHVLAWCVQERKDAEKTATVQEYLKKVQDSLSDKGFQKFKESMMGYKKVSLLDQYILIKVSILGQYTRSDILGC